MKTLITVIGNTGVGKSRLAVELAKAFNGEVINGDSMQMYQGLDIITNKHPVEERDGVPHHLLGHVPWNDSFTVQRFESEVDKLIADLDERGKLPIVVGGTHYYIQSLISKASLIGQAAESKRPLTEQEKAVLDDPAQVEVKLKELDPIVASKFHPNDTRRLRRALEIYYTMGKMPSEIYHEQEISTDALKYKVLVFWVYCDRDTLNTRLNERVDTMVQQGLMQELEGMFDVWNRNPESEWGVWQVLGFRQFLPYLTGSDQNMQSCVEIMKSETRQYAKRQTKWIVNKLIPFLQKIGGTLAALDSSDLASWSTAVQDRAIHITKDWLQSVPITVPLIPPYVDAERKQHAYSRDQWVRYRCDVCSRRKSHEVVIMGDQAWKTHLSSKGHQKIASRAKGAALRSRGPESYAK